VFPCDDGSVIGSARRVAAALLGAALVLTGCSSGRTPAPALAEPTSPIPVGAACLTQTERAGAITFGSGSGARLAGVTLGGGPNGVVLAHGPHGDVCEWMPYARVLAGLGYHVFLFDFNGYGASGQSPGAPVNPRFDLDVAAAVAQLRHAGAATVVLLGSEFGGLASVVAAVDIRPAVAGVVDLSGPSQVSGLDGPQAAPHLTVPALFVDSAQDQNMGEVRRVYDADRDAQRRLAVIPGYAHGLNLLDPTMDPGWAANRTLVESFLSTQR
jgi:pimeloyl-ACP methyl ester carboxylesterase